MSFHLFKRYLMAFCLVCLSLSASIGAANDENISDEDHTDEQLMEMSIEQLWMFPSVLPQSKKKPLPKLRRLFLDMRPLDFCRGLSQNSCRYASVYSRNKSH